MKNITIDQLLEKIEGYNPTIDKSLIIKAYQYAEKQHLGQLRQSGDPYISHPLNVAFILAELHADEKTICAGLLHDTIEDSMITEDDIEKEFDNEIALLVSGVTKLAKMNFTSKKSQNLANTRKIITSISKDVRIIIIKLADRLHNMRTLQYKSERKQQENALETLEIFVPLAYYIGAYRIKSELEDISFQYLKPENYQEIKTEKINYAQERIPSIKKMLQKINDILVENNIPNEIKVRTKNIYGIYKSKLQGQTIDNIHDFLALKIMVEEIDTCYITLGKVHEIYHPVNGMFKDYIWNPKTNMYRSLHTTLFGEDNHLVQTQIRTHEMDKVASFGLTAYWDIVKGDARGQMQQDLKEKYQFFRSLIEIDNFFLDNQEFVTQVKQELFADKIYVYTTKGEIVELPKGATPIDLAYNIHTSLGDNIVGAIINDQKEEVITPLHNKDRVTILTDENFHVSKENWENIVQTTRAKRKIKEWKHKNEEN